MTASIEMLGVGCFFRRGGAEVVQALRDLTVSVDASQYVTVIGPNGAGKSTFVNVLAGSVIPQRGTVRIGGRDVTAMPDYRRARWVGRVFQDPTQATCD